MRPISLAIVATFNLVVATSAGAAPAPPALRAPLPPNVAVDDGLRARFEEALARSATLRRQFDVIAGAPTVVEVRVSPVPLPGSRRAETTINRYTSGFLRARVVVPLNADFVELLAHELEHVVEQIQGVDLAALARAGRARVDSSGVFETIRARDAGRTAALEVEEGMRTLVRALTRLPARVRAP